MWLPQSAEIEPKRSLYITLKAACVLRTVLAEALDLEQLSHRYKLICYLLRCVASHKPYELFMFVISGLIGLQDRLKTGSRRIEKALYGSYRDGACDMFEIYFHLLSDFGKPKESCAH